MDDEQFTLNDGYRNFVANLGTEGDKASAGHYTLKVLTTNDLIAMYRGSWLAQKIVDIIPDDATRQWRNWNAEKEEITKIEDEEKRLRLKEKMRAAIKSARLFGMAAIHIALESDGDDPAALANPIEPESISAGGISHLTVIPKIALSAEEISTDPLSEYFGQPEFYRIVSRTVERTNEQVRIHASRLIVFYGKQMPEGAFNLHPNMASDSVLQVCFEAIRDTDAITANVNSLIFESKVDVIKVKNLNRDITIPGYEAALLARFSLANRLKSTNSLLLLDGEEEFDRKNASFGELSQIMDRYFQNVAGASDIPLTRLYGMSPAGLNATGESDLRNYYDRVKIMQELDIDPQMAVFNQCLKASALGDVRDDIFHEWRPLWQMTDKEKVEIGKIVTEIASSLVGQNIIRPDAVSEATANALIEYGVMPGLEAAIDEFGGAIPEGPSIEQQIAMMGKQPQPGQPGEANARPKPKLVVNNDMEPTPLYVRRDLLNTAEFKEWAKGQGFEDVLDDLHVTITYSKTPVNWMKMGEPWEERLEIAAGGPRAISKFGEGAIVLEFASSVLKWRHEHMVEEGASHDFPDYAPHVTITYNGGNIDVSKITPYKGRLIFGPEVFEPIDTEWKNKLASNDERPKKRMTREEVEFWREIVEAQGFDPDDPEFDPRKDPDIEIVENSADFDPGQPRDNRGRWTRTGAGAGGAPADAPQGAAGRSYTATDEKGYQDMARAAKASQGAAGLAVTIAEGADAYFMAGNGMSGFAMRGADFIGVVNHKDNPERGVVGDMLKTAESYAREKGFTELTLDCFDAFLPKYYAKFGFEETERVTFDWDYAPEGWTKAHGEPDVVFMRKKL